MGYLLDTCALSELRKPNCNAGVATWIAGIQPDEVFLSVLTIGGIRRGIELHRRKSPTAAGGLERWLGGLKTPYGDRILPITAAVADAWGRLLLAQPWAVSDGLIAATALEHRSTVVTRKVPDFARSGVGTLDPFG